ncbi:MAG: 2,3,4,5-tetrahydropyridine-2-carboxylate N-succinyltransferase [Glaciecola sp.]|jgi:2,3,4,5-tetrahydropyridine-2-carboxylate N-succinyltransferase
MYEDLRASVADALATPDAWQTPEAREAVAEVINLLDRGSVRVAEKDTATGDWTVHVWLKQAILLLFRQAGMSVQEVGPFEYHDKLALKSDYAQAGVRVVPPATARHGAHLERGVILMPSYVNIGAWVGAGTMVDTWATVGSCAQIGANVHLSGGVGIGGVLEPPGASPVIIEDGCFVGSRAVIVEGVHLEAGVVVGANTVLTMSTPIIDVTGEEPVEHRGRVPAGSVVIPGSRPKTFPAGTYQIPCALIIGQRKESTDMKTSLNEALRDHGVQV